MVNKFTNHIHQISFLSLFKSLVRMLPNPRAIILISRITCEDVGHVIIVNTGQATSKIDSQDINKHVTLSTC